MMYIEILKSVVMWTPIKCSESALLFNNKILLHCLQVHSSYPKSGPKQRQIEDWEFEQLGDMIWKEDLQNLERGGNHTRHLPVEVLAPDS